MERDKPSINSARVLAARRAGQRLFGLSTPYDYDLMVTACKARIAALDAALIESGRTGRPVALVMQDSDRLRGPAAPADEFRRPSGEM